MTDSYLAALENAAPFDLDLAAQCYAARALATDLVARIGLDLDQIAGCFDRIPDNALMLLHSPQGWGVLATFIASHFDMDLSTYHPTQH